MSKKIFKEGINLQPQSATPTSPDQGDMFISDGTVLSIGLYVYNGTTWEEADVSAHIIDTTAHAASSIVNTPSGNLIATDIQTALDELQGDIDTLVSSPAGGGGLDTYVSEDFSVTDSSNFTSGNHADFLTAGTFNGTLSDETVSPLTGTTSIKYVQAASSLNDWVASEAISLDAKQAGNTSGFNLYFTYDGLDSDIEVVVYDVTNSKVLTSATDLLTQETNSTRFVTSFTPPTNCTEIKYGFQVKVENIGATLIFDDVEMSTNPFVYKQLVDDLISVEAAGNGGGTMTANVTDIDFTEISDSDNAWNGSVFTALKAGAYNFKGITQFTTNVTGVLESYINGTLKHSVGEQLVTESRCLFNDTVELSEGDTWSLRSNVGVTLSNTVGSHWASITSIPQTTEHLITPAKTNLTDWVAYTPTLGFFGNGTSDVFYRRVGDSIEVQGRLTIGSSLPTGIISVSTPTGIVLDQTRMHAGNSILGSVSALQTHIGTTYLTGSNNVGFSGDDGTSWWNATSPVTFIAGNTIDFKYISPVVGWSSDLTFLAAIPTHTDTINIRDGITAPDTKTYVQLYVDSADGDLKVKFSDGTVKTIVVDT